MMKKFAIAMAAVLAATIALSPTSAFAQTETRVTAGAAGTFPSGTTYSGVRLSGLRFGLGVTISSSGSAEGDFQTTLLGPTLLGQPQQTVVVVGKALIGSVPALGTATFSGTATVQVGGGPPVPGVPFTATVAPNAGKKGTLTLLLNTTSLPAATVSLGSATVSLGSATVGLGSMTVK